MLYSKIEGSGKPLLILHGFLGMSDNWKTLGVQFSTQGFQVHMLDLRNHGRSFQSDKFTYELMMQDVLHYCKEKNLNQIYLIGHSMGGKVAMNLAINYPELVTKLIVADIAPKYYKPHHQSILEGLNAVDFSLKPDRSQIEEILKVNIKDFGTRQFLMKSLYWKEPGMLSFRFNLNSFNKNIEEIGKALDFDKTFNKPTLFIRGGSSDYILDQDFEAINHHFKNSDIKTIPNVGHWLHAENPKEFFDITIDFFQTNN